MCTKISWVSTKRSSKAEDKPKKKDMRPIHIPNTAMPLKKFLRFLIFVWSYTKFRLSNLGRYPSVWSILIGLAPPELTLENMASGEVGDTPYVQLIWSLNSGLYPIIYLFFFKVAFVSRFDYSRLPVACPKYWLTVLFTVVFTFV